MKTVIKALLLSSSLLIPFAGVQADDDDYPYGMGMMGGYGMMDSDYNNGYHMRNGNYGRAMTNGYGMGHGMGMMGGYGMGLVDLSDEQIAKMQKIRSKSMQEMSSVMDAMAQARNQLWKAVRSNDKAKISQAYDEMAEAKKQAFMHRMEMREKMQNILTDDQKSRLQNAYRGMMMWN